MKAIVVPTDFSELSKVAAYYAAGLAGHMGAKLVLVHAVHMEGPPRAILKEGAIVDAMAKAAEADGRELVREIRLQTGDSRQMEIEVEVIRGYPVHDLVEDFALRAGAGLVVIGTHGATGLRKVLLGSTATALINNSSIPVIAVPGEARYNGIRRMLYATDLLHLEEEIDTLATYTSLFKARMDAVHVATPEEMPTPEQQEVIDRLSGGSLHPEIDFHAIRADSVVEGIEGFAETSKADLITLFTNHLGFFKKWFGKSVAREMAFHTHLPLLTIRKN